MSSITAIVTAFRRPQNIHPLVEAIRRQTVQPSAVWAWANDPSDRMEAHLAEAKLDRVVTSSENALFHGRFALALLARTEFVAIFDDDSIPGENWFASCLETMSRTTGILGTAGVVLHEPGYAKRTMHGWQRPTDEAVEVDLVGQAWFLRSEWVKHLFSGPAVTGTNGEDIELAARAWRLAGVRSFCPPHPAGDQSRWGSTRGLELGIDEVAASLRVEHLAERKKIVEAEIASGWRPLFMRRQESEARGVQAALTPALSQREREQQAALAPALSRREREQGRCPRWVTEGRASDSVTLCLEGVEGDRRCLNCIGKIEAIGDRASSEIRPTYDRIDCGAALEHVRDPLSFLRRANRLLKPDGRLLAHVANVRRESVARGLIEGRWVGTGQGSLRFFTRRELEKLFYRAGCRINDLEPSPSERGQGESGSLPLPPGEGRGEGGPAPLSTSSPHESEHERYQITALPETQPNYGLTSIIIVTHNQVAYTRACLESIRFVTDEPYELIVVDNGSTDGTVEYLRSCADVNLIENADNRGFPAGVNQGIRASTGAQVLLLNNDVLVTTGWLRRMLEALESEASTDQSQNGLKENTERVAERPHPSPLPKGERARRIGLVGPLTNCASGYQEIAASYTDLAMLDGFAWEHAKQYDGQLLEVDRLIGFCLLIRREVLEQVGLLDERFGIGNYEDDDYCRRARDRGWRLVVARDAFIHHFGHKTFDGAGVDLNSLLVRNRQVYDDKWAHEETGSARVPGQGTAERPLLPLPLGEGWGEGGTNQTAAQQSQATSSPVTHAPCPLLSLCMIVRNNAGTVGACLESIKPWVDEMIVVDTGSTDATPDICRELGAEVHHFPWPDSFAIARNESLKYARGQWIFWMDSDDVIDADNGRKLRQLVNSLPLPAGEGRGEGGPHRPTVSRSPTPGANSNVLGYVMQVHCPGNGSDGAHDVTVVDHLKLFRNRPDLRFEGRIHEQVLDAVNRAAGDVVFTNIFVVHAGADHSPEGRKRKLKRDIKLLRLDLRERPNHTFVHFNLGMTYADACKHRKAIKSLRRSLQLAQPHESHVRKIYALLVSSHRELGQQAEARQACAEGLKLYPQDPELLFRQAMLMHEDGRLRAAELSYLGALSNSDALHFSSMDRGIVGFKARHNLAAVYTDMGALHRAEAEWRKIIDNVPTYRDGWRGLVENLLLQGRLSDAAQITDRLLASHPGLRGLGLTLAARVEESRGQIDAALATLRRAQAEYPDDVVPLDELCRLLFHRGEREELEGALRELVRRQPDNAAAHHNLGTVLIRSGRFQEAAEMFRTSLRERPDSPVTQLSLGYALTNMGQRLEAGRFFEQCVRLAAGSPLAAEAHRQLAAVAV
jgi:GT2 family glycosyltransferase/tetratricopeptide (TPR) repeat protein/SAM-dependent methyltransferase